MKYLDSNIFIYAAVLEKSDRKSHKSRDILVKMAEGKFEGATSALTWDELVWAVKRISGKGDSVEEGAKFLEIGNLKVLNVDEAVLRYAQDIMARYGLNPRDSIHAACAVKNNITDFVSFDSDFDAVNEIDRIKL